ncbi:MAG: tape measure protein [Leeuwenhoekiella sp.]|uniref:tape measure protein n=1 Tax=Leeuwenhoekiella sp. TaxID=1977054 RepID=UPI003241CC77
MNGLQYALELLDRNFGVGIRKAKASTAGLDQAVNKTNSDIAKVRVTGERSFGGLGNIARRVAPLVAGVFALSSVLAFGREVTQITAQFEGFENAIQFASGEDGGENLAFLDSKIKELNLDMAASYKGFQTLSGSLKGTSLEGQGLRDIFEGVATAATVMNLSAEQSEGAFLALSQMASKGKVQAEEIRGQLGERIPGALKIAADAMGVTQAQFNEMLDRGEVYAEDFLPKFSKQLKETFEGGLGKAAESTQAAINRKNNAFLSFQRTTGEVFRPLIIGVLEAGTTVFGFLNDLMQHLDPVKNALSVVWQVMEPIRQAFAESYGPMMGFADGGTAAKDIMEALGKVIESTAPVIGFLSEIIGFLQLQTLKIRAAFMDAVDSMMASGAAGEFLSNIMATLRFAWEVIQPAISVVFDILAAAVGVIFDAIGAMMEMVNAIFEWGRQTEWVQKVLNALVGVVSSVFGQIKEVAMNVLGSVGDLLVGVFTLDIDKIKSGLSKGFNAIGGAVDTVGAAIDGAVDGWNKKLDAPIKKNVDVTLQEQQTEKGLNGAKTPVNQGLNGGTTVPGSNTGISGQGVAGGGGTTEKHTTFNIQSFIQNLTIQTTNLKENPQELKRMLTNIFGEMVADLELRANA